MAGFKYAPNKTRGGYIDHDTAWTSEEGPFFEDRDGEVFLITNDGWVSCRLYWFDEYQPSYPVKSVETSDIKFFSGD